MIWHAQHGAERSLVAGLHPLTVTEHLRDPSTGATVASRTFQHMPIFGGMCADSPATIKVSGHLPHMSFLGCGSCTLRGTNEEASGQVVGMHFLGYHQPTKCGLRLEGVAEQQAKCGDANIFIPHEQQVARAQAVEAGEWPALLAGCYGMSPIVQALPYASYDTMCFVPLAHAGLLGTMKDFWGLVLPRAFRRGQARPAYCLPPSSRAVMKARAAHVIPTCDFSRPYTDVVEKRGHWVMENWKSWAEVWSPYILQPYRPVCLCLPMTSLLNVWFVVVYNAKHPGICCVNCSGSMYMVRWISELVSNYPVALYGALNVCLSQWCCMYCPIVYAICSHNVCKAHASTLFSTPDWQWNDCTVGWAAAWGHAVHFP